MSNERKNIQKKSVKSPSRPVQKPLGDEAKSVSGKSIPFLNSPVFLLPVICVITFICYRYSLHNQFLNWDDGIYVVTDPYITSFSRAHIFSMLFQNITQNYYHPLTMITYGLNYSLSGMNPMGYFLFDIIIHILNVVVIFYFTRGLMESMTGIGYKLIKPVPWLVATLALWHGIHPMHVESVSWISERKDVMYSLFYFLGLFLYLKYLKGENMKWMMYVNILFTLICVAGLIGLASFSINFTLKAHPVTIPVFLIFSFLIIMFGGAAVAEARLKTTRLGLFYVFEIFLLSLWSKPMAVAFPLSLICIDILMKRELEAIPEKGIYRFISSLFSFTGKKISTFLTSMFRLFLEKWLFLLTTVLSGIQSIILSVDNGSIVSSRGFTVIQKLLIACYAFTMYTVKAFYPANLCSFYPYPALTKDNGFDNNIYYWAPLFAFAIIVIPLILAYINKKNKDSFRVTLFCLLFYFSNLVFILQFLSAGKTVISDRYSYVSYFGLFFFFIYFATHYWQKNKSVHLPVMGLVAIVSCCLGYLCYERTKAWHDPKSLWTDVAVKLERHSTLPYMNLGDWYVGKKEYDSAAPYYRTLAELHADLPYIYLRLGKIYGMHGMLDSSLYYTNHSITLDSTSSEAYDDRAVTYSMLGKQALALRDYNKGFSLDSMDDGIWEHRGFALFQTGQYALALKDYSRLIKKFPDKAENYSGRGDCELNLNNFDPAIADFLKALSLNPKDGNSIYNLSVTYQDVSDYRNAVEYAQKAEQAGYKLPEGYLVGLQKHLKK